MQQYILIKPIHVLAKDGLHQKVTNTLMEMLQMYYKHNVAFDGI
jgi:hypothetical protein